MMQFVVTVPQANGAPRRLNLQLGETLFVLGANGSGKSSLMYSLFKQYSSVARRISAHRQTWMTSNTLMFSPHQKRQSESRVRGEDSQPQSRWKDDNSSMRPNLAIYDLMDAENVRAREITGAVDGHDIELAKQLSRRDSPIKAINELLRLSNLPITISVQENEEIVASRLGGPAYSIAELSDGERNALLIAANILTAQPGTLFVIDEPERHLHRSIISPLLTLLFDCRSDCAFVVSTHEVMLPVDNPAAKTLLLRSCSYSGPTAAHWDSDVVESASVIDEALRGEILGARRAILFVEGVPQSLDTPLYSLVFPEATVVPKASCRDVEHAVSGIRDSESLHWVKAFGVVDGDRRAPEELEALRTRGVYALPVIAVEAIYYHPEIQRRVAARQASVTGDDPGLRLAEAKQATLDSLRPHKRRLSERVAEKEIRALLLRQLPQRKDIAKGKQISISIEPSAVISEEESRFTASLEQGDVVALLSRYPARETQALSEIAKKLGFLGRVQYESAVRKLLVDEAAAIEWVRSLFERLVEDMTEERSGDAQGEDSPEAAQLGH